MNVRQEHKEACNLLAARYYSEFRGLLNGINGITASIGETDNLCLGGLRL